MTLSSTSNPGETPTRAAKLRFARRSATAVVLLIILVWCIGFTRFVESIPRAESVSDVQADAIVVLTGGAQRLGAGFRLLREGKGKLLFVSGVNEDVRPVELHALAVLHESAQAADLPKCCVELGFKAMDTKGNGSEIAAWVQAKNMKSLIMVTSNYHMPRAYLEIRAALPGLRIYRHHVVAPTVMLEAWWRWPGSLALLAGEYQKLLLAGFRILLQDAGLPR